MPRSWMGSLVSAAVLVLVAAVLLFNLERGASRRGALPVPAEKSALIAKPALANATMPGPITVAGGPYREYPIGLDVTRNHIKIAAIWLPPVRAAGSTTATLDEIHLVLHAHATEGNPNGFARGEWIPYLSVRYTMEPTQGGPARSGILQPMVAGDGPHYGADLKMPGAGRYRVTYRIEPPATNGLGRYLDPVTPVAPWWEPFEVGFDWDYQPQ